MWICGIDAQVAHSVFITHSYNHRLAYTQRIYGLTCPTWMIKHMQHMRARACWRFTGAHTNTHTNKQQCNVQCTEMHVLTWMLTVYCCRNIHTKPILNELFRQRRRDCNGLSICCVSMKSIDWSPLPSNGRLTISCVCSMFSEFITS